MADIIKALSEVKTDGVFWLGGDLNLPDIINWKDQTVTGRQYPSRINSLLEEGYRHGALPSER
jgi:hypothetical protein